jgi:hypothetical protein
MHYNLSLYRKCVDRLEMCNNSINWVNYGIISLKEKNAKYAVLSSLNQTELHH